MLAKHPVRGSARSVTLQQLADFLAGWLPDKLIQDVLRELQNI